jgi:hypothetical protein
MAGKLILKGLPWILCAALILPTTLRAQDYMVVEEEGRFGDEELTQMLAPIALYPDSLIAQILMASTYPLEIVEAERWMSYNRGLKGEALNNALLDKPWDPSVKSLCHFPDLLIAMSSKPDQTRRLGDAFLGQEDDVMATIQELRRRAEESGNLMSSDRLRVVDNGDYIEIVPADPEVIYLPVYNPMYVYGPWWYPDYPPYYWYYPQGISIGTRLIGFGPRIFFGFNFFSWVWCDWHSHRIHVDYKRVGHFDRRYSRAGSDRYYWSHDPRHRKGVAYRDPKTSIDPGGRTLMTPGNRGSRGYPARDLEKRIRVPERSPKPVERRGGVATGGNAVRSAPGRITIFSGVGQGSSEERAVSQFNREQLKRKETRSETNRSERTYNSRRRTEATAPGQGIPIQDGFKAGGSSGSRALARGTGPASDDSRTRMKVSRPDRAKVGTPDNVSRRESGEHGQRFGAFRRGNILQGDEVKSSGGNTGRHVVGGGGKSEGHNRRAGNSRSLTFTLP